MADVTMQQPDRRAALFAVALIFFGSVGVQVSSAVSATLFDAYGTLGTSALRLAIAGFILLIAIRPSFRGRSIKEWGCIAVFGTSMALMNTCLYNAIERLPLGIAVTLDFLGPCTVALATSRHAREALCALVAVAGVALISAGPWGYFDLVGYLFGIAAATCFGFYTVFAAKIGKSGSGLDRLALAVGIGAVLTLPFAADRFDQVSPSGWGFLALSALIGVVIPYAIDTFVGRTTSARVISTLFAIGPALGALIGFFILGESITLPAASGIIIVATSGALLVWFAERRPLPSATPARPLPIRRRKRMIAGGGEHHGLLSTNTDPPRH